MKILVTGGDGFIGNHLFRKLRNEHEVICIDDAYCGISVQEIENDDPQFTDVDVIFHLAATPRVGVSIKHPEAVINNNVTSTLRLLEFCRLHPTIQLINISSS